MRIPIEPEDEARGSFSDLLRLQTDFYTRLTEETMRYLRRLQGVAAPAVPGTVLKPGKEVELRASGSPGTTTELQLQIENRQRVHCVVTTMLSPLVSASGVTWLPATDASPPSLLLAPAEVASLQIKLPLPTDLPPGEFHGALLLQGFDKGAVAVTVSVIDSGKAPNPENADKEEPNSTEDSDETSAANTANSSP